MTIDNPYFLDSTVMAKTRRRLLVHDNLPIRHADGTVTQPAWKLKQAPKIAGSQKLINDLVEMLTEIESHLRHYIRLENDSVYTLWASWIVLTYLYKECFDTVPYLQIRSEVWGSGKSAAAELLASLSNGNPKVWTSPTAATVFRSEFPTMFFDEAEALRTMPNGNGATLIAILNTGFSRNGSVPRTEEGPKKKRTVTYFSTFAPKCIVGLSDIEETTASRALLIIMFKAEVRPPRRRIVRFETDIAKPLRFRLTAWAKLAGPAFAEAYGKLGEEPVGGFEQYDSRFQDIIEPLLLICQFADLEGGTWTKNLTRALHHCHINRTTEAQRLKAGAIW